MKQKVGKLYRKRIVEGDINLVDPNSEIHINDLTSSKEEGGGEVSYKYYRKILEKDIADLGLPKENYNMIRVGIEMIFLVFNSRVKVKLKDGSISFTPAPNINENDIQPFESCYAYVVDINLITGPILDLNIPEIMTFRDFLTTMDNAISNGDPYYIMVKSLIDKIEITKEEFLDTSILYE
jgi:hypothetical protein